MSEHDPSKAPEDWPPPLSDAEKKARIAELTEKVKSEGIALWENARLKNRIAELEARILALETVTDEQVERAAKVMYEDFHRGLESIWPWDDGGLDDEHPGARDEWLRKARAALSIRRGE